MALVDGEVLVPENKVQGLAIAPAATPDAATGIALPPLSLQIDRTEDSLFVLLVANWCRSKGRLTLDVQQAQTGTQAGPLLVTPKGEVVGPNTISRCLAAAAGDIISAQLLGQSAEAEAEVSQWLTWRNTGDHPGQLSASGRLEAMNIYLAPRAVLAGLGTTISLADLATFSLIHGSVAALPSTERATFPHLMRWFDYIQMKGDVDAIYERVPVEKAKFRPPAPLPPTPKAAPAAPKPAQTGPTKPPPAAAPAAAVSQPEALAKEGVAPAANGQQPSENAAGAKEGGGKKEKKEKEKKEKPPAQKKEVDTGVSVLDIRVGEIKKVWKHPGADTLYVEEIDLGEGQVRQVVSGLAKYLTEEEMLGRRVLVLKNVKAGKVRDVASAGLVLCASNEDHSQCQPVAPPAGAAIGERVTFAGHDGAPEEVLNPKKKQLEKIQPDLRTDSSGVAAYQGIPFMTTAGPCTSSIVNATIK